MHVEDMLSQSHRIAQFNTAQERPPEQVGAKTGLLVQHDAQERSVDLKSAVVLNETQLSEFVHEKLTRGCVVPIISANVSCDI